MIVPSLPLSISKKKQINTSDKNRETLTQKKQTKKKSLNSRALDKPLLFGLGHFVLAAFLGFRLDSPFSLLKKKP